MSENNLISVSYHIHEKCNMSCKYCFAKYEYNSTEKKILTMHESFLLIDELSNAGFKKISFAGGEPTLCDWLSDIIVYAKKQGLVTMLVTNGTGLTDDFLRNMVSELDWIGLSVDSLQLPELQKIGRQTKNMNIDSKYYYNIVDKIKKYNYKLKINTVVSSINFNNDITDFINYSSPLRWKLCQMFPTGGLECEKVREMEISIEYLLSFYERHLKKVDPNISIIIEDIDVMFNSYIMIDPIGRFYQNKRNNFLYKYSSPIIEIGVHEALKQINIDEAKREKRKAVYDW